MLGIQTYYRLAAAQAVTASVTPVVMTGFTVPVAAGQKVHLKGRIPFSLGATGGYRFQVVVPASPGNFVNTYMVVDAVTPTTIVGVQTSSAAFANALAVAGNHYLDFECDYVNGTVAGNVTLQFACNSAAGVITAFQGAWMTVTATS